MAPCLSWKKMENSKSFLISFIQFSYHQSQAILRFLAMEYGFWPEDAQEQYLNDELIESLKDFWMSAFPLKDVPEEKKKEAFEDFVAKKVVPLFTIWEKQLKENSSQEYMVGDKFTLIDVGFANLYGSFLTKESLKEAFAGILAGFPILSSYFETRHTELKDYFDSRPECPF